MQGSQPESLRRKCTGQQGFSREQSAAASAWVPAVVQPVGQALQLGRSTDALPPGDHVPASQASQESPPFPGRQGTAQGCGRQGTMMGRSGQQFHGHAVPCQVHSQQGLA